MTDLSQKIRERYAEVDPTATGSIFVRVDGMSVEIYGTVNSVVDVSKELSTIASELVNGMVSVHVVNQNSSGLNVIAEVDEEIEISETVDDDVVELDEIEVSFYGEIPIDSIVANDEYKTVHQEMLRKVEACVEVLGFVEPIVLDRNLKVVDGNLRLQVLRERAKRGGSNTIPVVVLNEAGVKADFLRLVLNRSNEFHRWNYREVDEYVDAMPQLQPLLEPLGFFGEKIIPASFFGNTVINYRINQDHDQQKAYKQEIGLDEWARIQRERHEKLLEAKTRKPEPKKSSDPPGESLFDMDFDEDDLIPTYDMEKVEDEYVSIKRDKAEEITDKFDKASWEAKKSKGQEWQGSRRSTSEKTEDNRRRREQREREREDSE